MLSWVEHEKSFITSEPELWITKLNVQIINLSTIVCICIQIIALDKTLFPTDEFWYLSYFSMKTYVARCFSLDMLHLPVLHHCADYIFISFGIIGPLWYPWNWSSAHVYARGRKQCCKLHYCLWRVSIKPRLPFSICNVFFVSKGNLFDFYSWGNKGNIIWIHFIWRYANARMHLLILWIVTKTR